MAGIEAGNQNTPASLYDEVEIGTTFQALRDFEARAKSPLFSAVKGNIFTIIAKDEGSISMRISTSQDEAENKKGKEVTLSRTRFDILFNEEKATNIKLRVKEILDGKLAA